MQIYEHSRNIHNNTNNERLILSIMYIDISVYIYIHNSRGIRYRM